MIKIRFSSTKGVHENLHAMRDVANDITHINRYLNMSEKKDIELPCPDGRRLRSGIAWDGAIWFGRKGQSQSIDLCYRDDRKDIVLDVPTDDRLNMLFKITCLSLFEHFSYTKIETDENFYKAIGIYEQEFGSIPDNAAECFGLAKRI